MDKVVIYSNSVGAPGEKITEGIETYDLAQDVEDAVNTDNAKYAHYYEKKLNEYDVFELHYIETTNA